MVLCPIYIVIVVILCCTGDVIVVLCPLYTVIVVILCCTGDVIGSFVHFTLLLSSFVILEMSLGPLSTLHCYCCHPLLHRRCHWVLCPLYTVIVILCYTGDVIGALCPLYTVIVVTLCYTGDVIGSFVHFTLLLSSFVILEMSLGPLSTLHCYCCHPLLHRRCHWGPLSTLHCYLKCCLWFLVI